MRAFAVSLALLGALLFTSACTQLPLVEAPLAPSVDIQIVDGRQDRSTEQNGYAGLVAFIPFVPWSEINDVPWLDCAFEPHARGVVQRSGLFGRVTGSNSPVAERRASGLILRVVLEDTSSRRVRTCYGLGVFAVPLHLVGIPLEYSPAVATLRVECVDRAGRVVASGAASNRDTGCGWIYESEGKEPDPAGIVEAFEVALADALAELDRDALGRAR